MLAISTGSVWNGAEDGGEKFVGCLGRDDRDVEGVEKEGSVGGHAWFLGICGG